MTNFSRDTFESKWESIIEKIGEIKAENPNNRISFLFYYSVHVCTFAGSNMLTHMVMIDSGEGYIPIEEKLRKLSTKSNVVVIAVLDCCRNTIESKSKVKTNQPDFGQLSLVFSCKAGRISIIKEGRSLFSKAFIEYFELPENQNKPYPNIAFIGFDALTRGGEHVNNMSKMVLFYEGKKVDKKLTKDTPVKEFLSYVSTEILQGEPDEQDDLAARLK